jgi:transposase
MSLFLHLAHWSSAVERSSSLVLGSSRRCVAKQLSISESCLRNWMAQDDADEGGSDSG